MSPRDLQFRNLSATAATVRTDAGTPPVCAVQDEAAESHVQLPEDLRSALARIEPGSPTAPARSGAALVPLPGGRTNRVFRRAALVIKLYDTGAASPLFPNDPAAEARALAHLGPLGLAPALVAAGSGWLVYRHLPGRSWTTDPVAAAVALGRLHALTPPPGFRTAACGSAAILAQARTIAGAISDATAGGQASRLPPPPIDPEVPPPQQLRLIHGDAVPGNMILHRGCVTLIDWQCPALGDPAEDLAAFLSPAMQVLYRGAPLTGAERQAFLAACPDPEIRERYHRLAPILHWRIAAHCLWRLERGDADYAAALAAECAALP